MVHVRNPLYAPATRGPAPQGQNPPPKTRPDASSSPAPSSLDPFRLARPPVVSSNCPTPFHPLLAWLALARRTSQDDDFQFFPSPARLETRHRCFFPSTQSRLASNVLARLDLLDEAFWVATTPQASFNVGRQPQGTPRGRHCPTIGDNASLLPDLAKTDWGVCRSHSSRLTNHHASTRQKTARRRGRHDSPTHQLLHTRLQVPRRFRPLAEEGPSRGTASREPQEKGRLL